MKTKSNLGSIITAVVLTGLVTTNAFADLTYSITIPAYPCGALVANQLNHTGGNAFTNVFGLQLPLYTSISFWDGGVSSPTNLAWSCLTTCLFDDTCPCGDCCEGMAVWYEPDDNTPFPQGNITLAPGQGAFVIPGGLGTVYFTGTPNVPILPAILPCGCGQWNLLSRQTNDIGTYENVTGLEPVLGAQVLRLSCGGFTTYTFSGTYWSPSPPSLNIGEAAFFLVPCPALSAQVVSNTTLQLTWPADHLGWRLEVQTNNLASGFDRNWFTVPGSDSVNQIPMPINSAGDGVFYRLRSP